MLAPPKKQNPGEGHPLRVHGKVQPRWDSTICIAGITIEKVVVNGVIDLVFGTGYNTIAAATNKGVEQKNTEKNRIEMCPF